jgi:hypothetical protein
MDDPGPPRRPRPRCSGRSGLALSPPWGVPALPLSWRVRAGRANDRGGDHGSRPPLLAHRLAPSGIGPAALARGTLIRHLPLALAGLHGDPPGTRRALRRATPARPAPYRDDRFGRPLLPLRRDAHTPRRPRTRLEHAARGAGTTTLAAQPPVGGRRLAHPGLAGAARRGRGPRQTTREARIPRQHEGYPHRTTTPARVIDRRRPRQRRTVFPAGTTEEHRGRPYRPRRGREGYGC